MKKVARVRTFLCILSLILALLLFYSCESRSIDMGTQPAQKSYHSFSYYLKDETGKIGDSLAGGGSLPDVCKQSKCKVVTFTEIEPRIDRDHVHQSHLIRDSDDPDLGKHVTYKMNVHMDHLLKHFEIADGGKTATISYKKADGTSGTISGDVVAIRRLSEKDAEKHTVELVIVLKDANAYPAKNSSSLLSGSYADSQSGSTGVGLNGVVNLFSMQDILSFHTFDGYKTLCQWKDPNDPEGDDYHARSVLCMLFWNMSPFATDIKKVSKDTTFDPNDGIGTWVDIYSASHGHVFSGFHTSNMPPGYGDTVSLVSDQAVGGDTRIEFDANVYAKFVDPWGNAVQATVAEIHMNWDPRSSPRCLNDSDGLKENYCKGLGRGYDCNWVYIYSDNCEPKDTTEEAIELTIHIGVELALAVAEATVGCEACTAIEVGLIVYEIVKGVVEWAADTFSNKSGVVLFMLSKTPQDPNNCYPPGSWCQTCKLKFFNIFKDPPTGVQWGQLYAYCKDEQGNWHYTAQSAPYGYGPNGNGPCLYTNKHGFLDCDCDPPGDWCKTCAAYGYDKSNDTLWAYCYKFSGYLLSDSISYSELKHVSWCEYITNGGGYLKCGQEAPCVGRCDGKECGDDGCGGSCGTCPNSALKCVNNMCCMPSDAICGGIVGGFCNIHECPSGPTALGGWCPDTCSDVLPAGSKTCKNYMCQ